jgi:amino acid adenylation domain-containing protein
MSTNSVILDSYLQQEKAYWLANLGHDIPRCGVPADFRHSGLPSSDHERTLEFTVHPELVERISKACRDNQSLVFAILVGALTICLHKYCEVDDVVVGSAIHGRNKGAAISNRALLLRNRLEATMTTRQLLDQIRHSLAEAYANQRYPFDKIREIVGAKDGQQLFGVAIVLDSIHDLENVRGLGQDMTLEFAGGGGQTLTVRVHYNAANLREETCRQFVSHYERVLQEMMKFPDKSIADVHLFSDEQRTKLLRHRNGSRVDYPRDATIHGLFEEQARLRPEATAVRYEGRSLTYRELNESANRMAHYLRHKGAAAETAVGISVERSLEMVVGLLGILKSGAAYVPIDPEYPRDRQQLMVTNSGVKLIVTQNRRLAHMIPMVKLVSVDEEKKEIDRESKENPEIEIHAENLAYVIYTSGSTGSPKGVAVPHRGVVRLVKEANYVELGAQEKILQLAPLSFDASTFEIWGSLLNGSELIAMSAGKPSLEALGQAIRENDISTMWLTAGLFQLLVDHCMEDLKGIGQLLVGGDVVSVAAAQRYLQGNPEGTLIDGYGPTENTTFTCCWRMRKGMEIGSSVPIGTPVSNTEVYIVDRNFDPVPVGVLGELYTGGDGLSRGYVGRPDLTAEKFVPNPFSDTGGERLYRTGDLARYRWDGAIEFVGRADQQVKIRGFRIEPAEIEELLGQHPGVRESVVLLEENSAGERQLTAYVAGQERLTRKELQMFLKETLPEYMMPSALVMIAALPLTDNGKIDREALAKQKAASSAIEEEQNPYVAPRNEMEEAIAALWRKVLGLQRVGIYDNFFEIGGHSLLAMRLCTKMNEQLTCKTRVTDLFLHPTIESLARRLSDSNRRPAVRVS